MARPALEEVLVQFSRRVKCKMGEYKVRKSGAKSINQSRLIMVVLTKFSHLSCSSYLATGSWDASADHNHCMCMQYSQLTAASKSWDDKLYCYFNNVVSTVHSYIDCRVLVYLNG